MRVNAFQRLQGGDELPIKVGIGSLRVKKFNAQKPSVPIASSQSTNDGKVAAVGEKSPARILEWGLLVIVVLLSINSMLMVGHRNSQFQEFVNESGNERIQLRKAMAQDLDVVL